MQAGKVITMGQCRFVNQRTRLTSLPKGKPQKKERVILKINMMMFCKSFVRVDKDRHRTVHERSFGIIKQVQRYVTENQESRGDIKRRLCSEETFVGRLRFVKESQE